MCRLSGGRDAAASWSGWSAGLVGPAGARPSTAGAVPYRGLARRCHDPAGRSWSGRGWSHRGLAQPRWLVVEGWCRVGTLLKHGRAGSCRGLVGPAGLRPSMVGAVAYRGLARRCRDPAGSRHALAGPVVSRQVAGAARRRGPAGQRHGLAGAWRLAPFSSACAHGRVGFDDRDEGGLADLVNPGRRFHSRGHLYRGAVGPWETGGSPCLGETGGGAEPWRRPWGAPSL